MAETFRPERLRTVQAVPLTAYDSHGELNLSVMAENTSRLFEAGMRVFIPCAGSSEFHSLAAHEIAAAIEMTRDSVDDSAVVMAPIGLQLNHALDVGRRSLDSGANCVLVMPLAAPYLSDAGARDYYAAVLEELACPTLIYKKADIPSDRLLLELADEPKVVGVKYAVNDIDAFTRIVRDDDGRIDWFCGSAERFAPFFMLAGATGYTSGTCNLCPNLTLAMHAACEAGDWAQALRLLEIIRPIEDYRAAPALVQHLVPETRHAERRLGVWRPPAAAAAAHRRRTAGD